MWHSMFASLAVGVIGLVAARLENLVLNPSASKPCAMIEKSGVVWPYEATDHTVASSCPGSADRRMISSSIR